MRGLFANAMSVGDAIDWGATTLDESDGSFPNSRNDATLLLRHVLDIPPAEIYASRELQLTRPQTEQFNALIRERAKGKPIQYITGQQEFYGLPFHVSPAVLIPRPETEHLVEAAIARLENRPAPRIVDVGTGSGAIAVALAHSLPKSEVIALDISTTALAVAARNAQQNGVSDRIRFAESDLLSAVAGEQFDAIISNPPYIAESERKSLPKEVRDYEPAQALFAGKTGLEFYQRLIPAAHSQLIPAGWLLIEIGHSQRDAVAALLHGWDDVEFVADLQSIPRVVIVRRS